MLGKDLFKHVPTGNGFCIHRAAPIWGGGWCYRGMLYHVQAAKATPSSGPLPDFISFCLSPQPSARTEAKNANSCTIELGMIAFPGSWFSERPKETSFGPFF